MHAPPPLLNRDEILLTIRFQQDLLSEVDRGISSLNADVHKALAIKQDVAWSRKRIYLSRFCNRSLYLITAGVVTVSILATAGVAGIGGAVLVARKG